MSSNYPPGVTGNEYEIAGLDYEQESAETCPNCKGGMMEQGYRGARWVLCYGCYYQKDLQTLPKEDF